MTNNVEVHGLTEDVLYESGDYGSGFWTNHLTVDLEELAAGNVDNAFSVDSRHDTYGTSFRIYHGIDVHAKLPNGAKREAVQELCNNIAADRSLIEGFRVEWDGNNHVGHWYDSDGERSNPEQWDDQPGDYWGEQFQTDAADLDAVQVYDISDSDNRQYIRESIAATGLPLTTEEEVLSAINAAYDNDAQDEYFFIGHAQAAAEIWERMQEEAAEEE